MGGSREQGRAAELQEEPSARVLGLAQCPDEFFCHFVKLIVNIMPKQNNLNSAPTVYWQNPLAKKNPNDLMRKKNALAKGWKLTYSGGKKKGKNK